MLTACHDKQNTNQKIQTILSNTNEDLDIGFLAKSLNDDKVIYEQHANRSFIPASTLKVFVATAALKFLGPKFVYKTTLSATYDAPVVLSQQEQTSAKTKKLGKTKSIHNLYIQFSGDPSLTRQDVMNLLKTLKEKDITQITGNIIIDANAFDGKTHADGWTWDELNSHYAAPVSTVVIDENSFQFDLYAGKHIGDKTKVRAYRHIPLTPVNNKSKDCNDKFHPLQLTGIDDNHYTLTGCMNRNLHKIPFSVSFISTINFAKGLLLLDLKQLGIKLNGKVITGYLDKNAKLLKTHSSAPLSTLVSSMLKHSNNLYANILLKTLGHYYYHAQGTFENGIVAEKTILADSYQLDFTGSAIVDGGGLSRYNLITPDIMVDLLSKAYQDDKVKPYLLTALPVAATDGTLKNRMKGLKGKVIAKTGTLAHSSNIAGYIIDKNNVSVFCFMLNHGTHSTREYHKMQDEVIKQLATK